MNSTEQGFIKYAGIALVGAGGLVRDGIKDIGAGLFALASAIIIIPVIPLIYLYFRYWVDHSNCLVWAVSMKLRNWRIVTIRRVKNSRGRSHFQVVAGGRVYEWYSKGSAGRSRWKNIWYKGAMRAVGRA